MELQEGMKLRVDLPPLTPEGDIPELDYESPLIMSPMYDLQGQVVTIKEVNTGAVYDYTIIKLEEDRWLWHENWLKPTDPSKRALPRGLYTKFEIPRKNKAPRKIVAPDDALKAYQRSNLKALERKFFRLEKQSDIQNVLHGFLPNRNVVTAAEQHIGYDLTIMMDIVAFFDAVRQDHTDVKDPNFYTTEGYCGQGFPTSPILANIAIAPAASAIKQYLQARLPDNFAFTIYADDIQISINGDIPDALEVIEVVKGTLAILEFQIHPHKTRIKQAKYGYRRILGINVGPDHIRATRKTMRKIRAAKHQSNGPSAGGLTTWSKCLLPKSVRKRQAEQSQLLSGYDRLLKAVPSSSNRDEYVNYFQGLFEAGYKIDVRTRTDGSWIVCLGSELKAWAKSWPDDSELEFRIHPVNAKSRIHEYKRNCRKSVTGFKLP